MEEGGAVVYKVAYVGLGPTGDEWINADAVPQQHLERFLQRWAERRAERKARRSAQAAAPKPPPEMKRKAEVLTSPGAAFRCLPPRCPSVACVSCRVCACLLRRCLLVSLSLTPTHGWLIDGRRRRR